MNNKIHLIKNNHKRMVLRNKNKMMPFKIIIFFKCNKCKIKKIIKKRKLLKTKQTLTTKKLKRKRIANIAKQRHKVLYLYIL